MPDRFEHYIFTRINCEYPDDPHYPPKLYARIAERRFDPDWMNERCEMIAKYAVPSIKAQTNQNFKWIILAHVDTPKEYKAKFEAAHEGLAVVKYTDLSPRAFLPEFLSYRATAPWVISTTLDSDDGISIDFVEHLQASFREKKEYYNFERGFMYSPEKDRFYGRRSERNPFISLVESTENIRGVFCRVHGAAHLEAPIRQIGERQGYWAQVVHGDNILNKTAHKSRDKGRLYSELSERFKLRL